MNLKFHFLLFLFCILSFSWAQAQTDTLSLLTKANTFSKCKPLLKYFNKHPSLISFMPSIFPLKDVIDFRVSSAYGVRNHPIEKKTKFHHGIDLACKKGTYVVAAANGVVRKIYFSNYGYGHNIIMDHQFGFRTRYGHLSFILVKKGQYVRQGELIAMVGSTGASTGAHLHFEVIKNNKHTNPSAYFFLKRNLFVKP